MSPQEKQGVKIAIYIGISFGFFLAVFLFTLTTPGQTRLEKIVCGEENSRLLGVR